MQSKQRCHVDMTDQPPQSPEGSLELPLLLQNLQHLAEVIRWWVVARIRCPIRNPRDVHRSTYFAVAVPRTINLSCCLVVDLGSPVCLLSATLPVLANRSLSLCMLRGSVQLVWHWTAFRTETAFACNAIFFRFKPAAPLDAFKRGQFFVVVAFVLLSTVARLTVTKLCACQHHVPSYSACYWLSKIWLKVLNLLQSITAYT